MVYHGLRQGVQSAGENVLVLSHEIVLPWQKHAAGKNVTGRSYSILFRYHSHRWTHVLDVALDREFRESSRLETKATAWCHVLQRTLALSFSPPNPLRENVGSPLHSGVFKMCKSQQRIRVIAREKSMPSGLGHIPTTHHFRYHAFQFRSVGI